MTAQSNTFNLKGTLSTSFQLGANNTGPTLYTGTTTPGTALGTSGDIYIYVNGSSSALYMNQGSSWGAFSAGAPISTSLDTIGSIQGDILYRTAGSWTVLTPGTNGQVLITGGSSANPSWSAAVTSVVSNNGLTVGTITSTGTIGLATITNNNLLANISGSTQIPVATTFTSYIDSALGSVQGSILYRNGSVWTTLTPGAAGQFLQTQGSSSNVQWAAATGSGTAGVSSVATGTGLTGGPITSTGTVSVASNGITYALFQTIGSNSLFGNPTASTATGTSIPIGGGLSFSSGTLNGSSGTVTSITTNNGLTGGPVTTTGTIGLATIANGDLLANISGSTQIPVATTHTALMDATFGSTQGDILYRNGSVWTVLTPGTSGYFLTTQGSGSNVIWSTPTGTGTVTSIATGTGLTGGPVTTAGTVSVASNGITYGLFQTIPGSSLFGNPTASTATGTSILLSGGLSFIAGALNGSSGTVTSVTAGSGLSGGPITSSGTIGLATISNNNLLANISGSTQIPVANTLTSLIDSSIGSLQGDILYRNGSIWTVLPPSASTGQFLISGGTSANPSWTNNAVLNSGFLEFTYVTAPSALTATKAAGSGLGTGSYSYVVTYVNNIGETSQGTAASVTTSTGSAQVSLTNIGISSDPTVTKRRIYRTLVGGSSYFLLTTLNNNTTTTFTDTTADGSLGIAAPNNNSSAGQILSGTNQIVLLDNNGNISINQWNGTATSAISPRYALDFYKEFSVTGQSYVQQVATPSIPTIGTSGTAGTKTYSYGIVAVVGTTGSSAISATGSTTVGNTTLGSANFNTITWTPVLGATSYQIYRTASNGTPSTTGLIGTVLNSPGNLGSAALTFNDTGLVGNGSTAPVFNTTGVDTVASTVYNTSGATVSFNKYVTAPSALTATKAAGSGLGTGSYLYAVTYLNNAGETNLSSSASVTTTSGSAQVSLTAIPTSSDATVIKRNIYRTLAGGTVYYLITTLNDNTTTTYLDTTSDTTLYSSFIAPHGNSTSGILKGGANVSSIAAFQADPIGGDYLTFTNVGTTGFASVSAPVSALTSALAGAGTGNLSAGTYLYKYTFLGTTVETSPSPASSGTIVVTPSSNGQISLTNIGTSSNSAITKRNIYRTTASGSTYYYLTTISDNVTTTFTDNIADSSLSLNKPNLPTANIQFPVYVQIGAISSSDATVGIQYRAKGTTTQGGQFNSQGSQTTGDHQFYCNDQLALRITDTLWNPNAAYAGPVNANIVLSSGQGVTNGGPGPDIITVISCESPAYTSGSASGVTLMAMPRGTSGQFHFSNNGMIGHVTVTAPSNPNGPDVYYGSANALTLSGAASGTNAVLFTSGLGNGGLTIYNGAGTGSIAFLGNNAVSSILQLNTPGTNATQGFIMNSSASGTSPLLSVSCFNNFTSPDTNLGLSISGRGTGAINFYSNTGSYLQAQIINTNSPANYLTITGANTGNAPTISGAGSDPAVGLNFQASGTTTAYHRFFAAGALQAVLGGGSAAVNNVTITGASSGGNPALSAQGSDPGVGLTIYTAGTGNLNFYTQNISAIQCVIQHTANASNYLTITGGSGSNGPTISTIGSNTPITITSTGTAAVNVPGLNVTGTNLPTNGIYQYSSTAVGISALSTLQLLVQGVGTAVNHIQINGAATGGYPGIIAGGSDTTVGMNIFTSGTGNLNFYTQNGSSQHFQVAHSGTAVNYLSVTGAGTANNVSITTAGVSTTVGLNINAKTSGTNNAGINLQCGGATQAQIFGGSSAVNYLSVTGASSGGNPALSAQGSDPGVGLTIYTAGTGNISFLTANTGTTVMVLQNSGIVKFGSSASFSANGTVATSVTSVGPTGAHATVQKWLTINDNNGSTFYIPCF